MAEKDAPPEFAPQYVDIAHDDKSAAKDANEFRSGSVDASGRRKSVALNLVENPLKVSFAVPGPSPPAPSSDG